MGNRTRIVAAMGCLLVASACGGGGTCTGDSCDGGDAGGAEVGGGSVGGGSAGGGGGATGGGGGGLSDAGSDAGERDGGDDAGFDAGIELRVFVTSAVFAADFGGTAAADALCQQLANGANKGGTWKAWLSSADEAALDRISANGTWYQQVDGGFRRTFNNKSNLQTAPLASIVIDEEGRTVPGPRFWTGTAVGGAATAWHCTSWTKTVNGPPDAGTRDGGTDAGVDAGQPDAGETDAGEVDGGDDAGVDAGAVTLSDGGTIGDGLMIGATWTNAGRQSCGLESALLCLEQSRLPVPSAPSTDHKRVFLTSIAYPGTFGGLAQADAICATAATAGNKQGTFRAWLSDATTNAADRIVSNGPWFQDPATGVPKLTFRNKASLSGTPLMNLDLDEQGRTVTGMIRFWTGTLAGGRRAPNRCGDWSAAGQGLFGVGIASRSAWTASANLGCDTPLRLLCVEE